MRYFVTGATGFIGGQVVRQLVAAGHEVEALVRAPSKARDLAAPGVRLHAGDITDRESLRGPMTGVDGLFHLAAWYKVGEKDKREAEAINVTGTRNVLEMMKELAIPKGVYTSTLAVNSDTRGRLVDESYHYDGSEGWISEYDRTKWLAHYRVAEPMIRDGLPLVIVMPGLVYGPGDRSAAHRTLKQYLQRRLPVIPSTGAFCWGHVEDMAHAHLQAMEKGVAGERYITAGPAHALTEVLALAERITGIAAPRLRAPRVLLRATAALVQPVERYLSLPESYTAEGLRAAAATYIGTNARARKDLGLSPRPLEAGLTETLRYEMEQLGMVNSPEPS